jgi:hypothetical protein
MIKTLRDELNALGSIVRMLALAAVGGAIYQEMRKPPAERTWHGTLLGVVPYDFRMPTPAKLVNAWWNPSSKQIVGDPAFGVGWSLNVAALVDRFQAARPAGTRKASAARKSTRKAAA